LETLRALFSSWYWRNGFSFARVAAAIFSAFGALWLLVEIVAFFSPPSAESIKDYWWAFPVIGLAYGLWSNRPIHSVCCKLVGRDVVINICIDDVFSRAGALVIGSNRTFDTDESIIDSKSVQGQFTSKYYSSSDQLNADI